MITSDKFKLDFEFIDPCLCNAWVATAIIGSGLIGAGATIFGATTAAKAQESAADVAAQTSMNMFNTTNTNLAPYRAIGGAAAGDLTARLSELTSPITMDESTLRNTPGYQFNLTQGERAVTNSSAARGLGSSGAALKGATTFATGLADSTYQNQFQNAVTNQTNAYNRLAGLVNTGETAAAGGAAPATAAAGQIGTAATNAGNAAAAASNASAGAVSNLAGNVGGYAAYKGLYGTAPGSAIPGAVGPTSYGGPNGPTPVTF
jgi:hypothetical protein